MPACRVRSRNSGRRCRATSVAPCSTPASSRSPCRAHLLQRRSPSPIPRRSAWPKSGGGSRKRWRRRAPADCSQPRRGRRLPLTRPQNPFGLPNLSQPQPQPTENERRLAFLNGPVDRRTVSSERVQAPVSPHIVQAGAVITAALITGLRSDLPGQVTAQVTENVYDGPTGRTLLIPQGARLIGQYDAQVTFGQSRALLVWNRVILPNGRSVVLERQPGADPSGYAGLEDEVDNHWSQVFRAAAISTLLSVGAEAGAGDDEDELIRAIRRGSSDSISQTGRQIVGRSLNVQPTLTVRPGHPVRVILTRDLILEPYRG
jgi:type IV secretion system protein TrbI